MLSSFSRAIIASGLKKLKGCKLLYIQRENIYKMKIILHKTGIAVLQMLIFFIIAGTASAQDDPSIKSPPGTKHQNQLEQAEQAGTELKEGLATPQEQVQNKNNKKKEEAEKKDVKEVKSTNPDMKKARGARPPSISRPSGGARPQGAGKPAGALKQGRR
jgi:hypothetical protein